MPSYDEIAAFFDRFADEEDRWLAKTGGYHTLLRNIYRSHIPPGASVLEIGSGRGDLLAALEPRRGLGVDVSLRMVAAARARHPELEFECVPGEQLDLGETFDYVVLSDVAPYVEDLQALFETVAAHSHEDTRVIVNTYSNVWRPVLGVLTMLGVRAQKPIRNWVAPQDLVNLFELAGLEIVSRRSEMLLPTRNRSLSAVLNGVLARLPGLRSLALTAWIVGRRAPQPREEAGVTVLVPCRNEAGSIESIVERVPEMGSGTEILFVEGHSADDTRERIAEAIERNPHRDMRLLVQTGKGKANAVREGFAEAKHDILMILDADLTVAPEALPKFYDALVTGRGELINGARLVYGMEPGAMRFLNMVANRLFATALSGVLNQYVKDTLCGTKAIHRRNYERIQARRHEIGEDPYGDFDLLLGASLIGLKIVNVPVRYGARTYGDTNIQRFSGGALLFKLAAAGFRRIWVTPVAGES